MLKKFIAITTLVAFVLLSGIIQSTSPSTIHPVGILFVFILFYLLALGLLTFFIFHLSKLMVKIGKSSYKKTAITFNHAYYYASVIALAPVLLIGMRSIGRGTAWDFVLVIVFELVACFYIFRRIQQ